MIFVDTSVIVAYANADDEFHRKAVEIVGDIDKGKYGTAVITDYVFDETMTTLLSKTKNFELVVENGKRLLNSSLLFLNIDSDLFSSTWKAFSLQKSQRLSFTDCSIIATCKMNGIGMIATFDRRLKEHSGLATAD